MAKCDWDRSPGAIFKGASWTQNLLLCRCLYLMPHCL
ncbi:unnamed protein product [Larinioides sclopetarius]|uniref:Uncharacterized protein n=1 Tax=Larinioides sclopetarius TaxID=280406 RepID=A0AAV1ZRF9_9ARAC